MYQDSQIAELVLRKMYEQKIPVLPVHDSFICPKLHLERLEQAMVSAYREVTGKRLTVTPYTVNIKQPDEHDLTGGNPNLIDEDYYYDITQSQDDSLIQHFINIEGDALFTDDDTENDEQPKIVTPHQLLVSIPVEYKLAERESEFTDMVYGMLDESNVPHWT